MGSVAPGCELRHWTWGLGHWNFPACGVIAALLLFGTDLVSAEKPQPVRLIFDTDMEADVDDVGATALLHALADKGEVEILAMGVSSKGRWSAACLDALNTYYGRPDIPIGVVKGPGVAAGSKYAKTAANEFPHDLTRADDAPDAALLYRKVLAAQPDESVVIVTVGFLTNLNNLLKTKPDRHSKLSGIDLVKHMVKSWVGMGGKYPRGRE